MILPIPAVFIKKKNRIKEKGEKKVAILETCTQNLKGIEEFVNEQIGKESPSFDELVNHLNEIKGLYRLCQKVAPTNTVNQSIQGSPGLSTVEEDPLKNQKEKEHRAGFEPMA